MPLFRLLSVIKRESPSSATFATRTFSVSDNSVFRVKRMALFAMCTRLLQLTCIAASHIFQIGDRLQVVRIDAAVNSAFMVWNQSFWDRSLELFIGNLMRWTHLAINHDASVPIALLRSVSVFGLSPMLNVSHPQPAAGHRLWQHMRHQTLQHSHGLSLAQLCNARAA